MINAAVQKGPVMGHHQKAPLSAQIVRQFLPSRSVEMIGRLIDEQKGIVPQKQCRQKRFRVLSKRETCKGLPQQLFGQIQQGTFPRDLPILRSRRSSANHLHGKSFRILHRIGKIFKFHIRMNLAAAGQRTLQQAQQCGLSAAVAAHEAQPPIRIQLKRYVFEHCFGAALVGKRQIPHVDQ